jgi:hypothetical protein
VERLPLRSTIQQMTEKKKQALEGEKMNSFP